MRHVRATSAILAIALLLGPVVLGAGCGSATTPAAKPEGEVKRFERGYRFDADGWIYVHVEGEPFDRGFQYGRLVAPELAQVKKMLKHTSLDETGREYEYFVEAAEELFTRNAEEEFLTEIKGVAQGAQSAGTDITWQEVLEYNGHQELTGYWYPGVQSGEYPGVDNTHCSAFMATGSYTRDGRPVMAHNNWDHFVTGQYSNIVLDIKPDKGHRIIMQSMPGMVASMTDFFVTDAGLMGTETTIGGYSGYDPQGLAEFYRMRKATQYADDMDQWVATMQQGNNGGYANSWLLADLDSGEIMRFEQGLEYQNVERTGDGFYVGFNCATDPRIRNLECGGDPTYCDTRTPGGARRVRLTRLMDEHKGRIDVTAAQQILADHYDVYLDKADNPCSRTVDGHYELDPFRYWQARRPYSPQGAVDGKAADAAMAKEMSFTARWGNSCGMPFDASEFLEKHPQWNDLDGYLLDRPSRPWVTFKSEMR